MSTSRLTVTSLFYHIIYAIARLIARIIRLWARWQVRGVENVPKEGPLVVVANHMNLIDVPILAVSLGRKATFMAKEELFRSRLQGSIMYALGSFPVHRAQIDLQAIRRAKQVLDDGGVLIMFPEGKRSDDARLQPGKQGSAMIALRTGVPILPVGIIGTENLKGVLSILRRPRIIVNIGQPFSLPPIDNNGDKSAKEKRAEVTELVMKHIAELLPAGYRGAYSGGKTERENRKG
jgi:1-acyl-sn-glycerol-3-phosphate acyltransferase